MNSTPFLSILWTFLGTYTLFFMVSLCVTTKSPAIPEEPIIYVTFTRWEDRTFSPRIYYLLMKRFGLENKLLDRYKYTSSDKQLLIPAVSGSSIPEQSVGVRSAFPIINNPGKGRPVEIPHIARPIFGSPTKQQNFLFLENSEVEPVHFPNPTEASDEFPKDNSNNNNFFADRIAYPGVSIRRTADSPEIRVTNRNLAYKPTSAELSEDDIVDTIQLTLDVIHTSDWEDQNYVFSPLSITNILALLLLGANGTSYDELAKRLRPNNPFTSVDAEKEMRFHSAFGNLITLLTQKANSGVTVDICNRILGDKKYPISDTYRDNAISYYLAQSNVFDFSTQGKDVQKSVNNWVSHKTAGKIPAVIDSPPGPETRIMLINAIYFKGNWETQFLPKLTRPKQFYISPTETIQVQMMANILTIPYLATESFRVIGLPYKGRNTGLFIYLPVNPGIKGLKEMERQLTTDHLKLFNKMKLTPVTVQLPKMKVEGDDHLKDLLQKFDVKSIFSSITANFSRLSDTPGLFISSILHKAVFEMNERGTEAAATTIATGDRNLDERPVLFNVNRPFAFSIYNIKAKSVLFFGRVTRPLPLES